MNTDKNFNDKLTAGNCYEKLFKLYLTKQGYHVVDMPDNSRNYGDLRVRLPNVQLSETHANYNTFLTYEIKAHDNSIKDHETFPAEIFSTEKNKLLFDEAYRLIRKNYDNSFVPYFKLTGDEKSALEKYFSTTLREPQTVSTIIQIKSPTKMDKFSIEEYIKAGGVIQAYEFNFKTYRKYILNKLFNNGHPIEFNNSDNKVSGKAHGFLIKWNLTEAGYSNTHLLSKANLK